jgi:hypothetical protein
VELFALVLVLDLLTHLCLSSGRWSCRCLGGERGAGVEGAVELAGDVALEAPLNLSAGFALGCATGDVVLGGGAAPDAGDGDGVDRAVQGPVAAAVEPMPNRLAAAKSGQASDQANWWARPVPATTTDRSEGHAEAAGSVESHIGHRHRAWWSSTQEHRNDTHRSVGLD